MEEANPGQRKCGYKFKLIATQHRPSVPQIPDPNVRDRGALPDFSPKIQPQHFGDKHIDKQSTVSADNNKASKPKLFKFRQLTCNTWRY